DGCDDIAVLYTIEGFCCGNNYSFYVAVFLNKGHKYEFATSEKIGGGGERIVALNAIRDGRIILDTKEYLPDDPMCCPSGKGKTTYSLKDGKLVESDCIGEKPISPIERFQRQLERIQPLVDELLNEKERQKRTGATQSK
ncbi:MAG: hypothetical protein HQL08_09645, partial [Nitrospirae bacterium]|nr:hypothetical protein [Nitrospirota bacterium]